MTETRANPAGDFGYEAAALASNYVRFRQPDPRIAAALHAALGDAQTVLNIGAGTGSYEPEGRTVLPIEPSAAMRGARPAHLAPAIDGTAESIPLPDGAADAAMGTITLHQWPDLAAGLRELRRVTRGPIAFLALDPPAIERFWMGDWVPSLVTAEAARHPSIDELAELLGPRTTVEALPVPLDCTDGLLRGLLRAPRGARSGAAPIAVGVEVRRSHRARGRTHPLRRRPGGRRMGRALRPSPHAAVLRRLAAARGRPALTGSTSVVSPEPDRAHGRFAPLPAWRGRTLSVRAGMCPGPATATPPGGHHAAAAHLERLGREHPRSAPQ